MPRPRRFWLFVAAMTVCAVGVGCGKAGTTVSGTVTLDGKPLGEALLQFVPLGLEGRTGAVRTDLDGRYQIELSPHAVRVSVSARTVVGQERDGKDGPLIDVFKELVPARFSDLHTSELRLAPLEGRNTGCDFDLTSTTP
jgi:hypothetical protein